MKKETIEEFLARGGNITTVPVVVPEEKPHVIKSSTSLSLDLATLGEGEIMFGEKRKKKKKPKKLNLKKINLDLIPDSLKDKLKIGDNNET